MTEQDARAALETAVLGVSVTREYSETVSSGRVIRTDPIAGARILRDGSVAVVVSQGPERFDAPKLVGLVRADAVTALTKVNLTVGTVTEAYDETVSAGTVVSSSVEPGTKLKRATSVDFVVSKGPKPIDIASYEGKAADQATKELQAAGFVVTSTQQNSATVAAGLVISQSPNSGQGKKGDTIALVVSKGPVMVAVPTVRGKSKADATTILQAAGFQVTTKSIVSSGIRTDPIAGARILRDGSVAVVVSQGPERFDAPKLVGLVRADAVMALTKVNLTVGTVTEAYDETVPAGTVVSSSVEPGTKLKRATTVDFVVSKGPKPIDIASYEGKSADQATKELQAAGFVVTSTQQNSATVAAGLVISQSPNSGQGKKGDTIALVVSKGPVMVAVPTVRGKSKAEATTILKAAGFQVTTKSIVSSGIAFGLAYGTDPGAGTMVAQGSTISLLVG